MDIMVELTEASKPTESYVIDHARARLIATYGRDAVPLPSRTTAYRIVQKLERMHPTFTKSTKLKPRHRSPVAEGLRQVASDAAR